MEPCASLRTSPPGNSISRSQTPAVQVNNVLASSETNSSMVPADQGPPGPGDAQPPLRRELFYTAGKLSEVRIYQDGTTLSEVRQLAYDGQGRLTSMTYRDGSMVVTRTRTLGYDGAGLLSVIEDMTP